MLGKSLHGIVVGAALAAVALLTGCGSTEVDLDTGPDFSDSPLRVSVVTPPRRILLFWEEQDDATHYRLFEDPNGTADGELDFAQLGDDIPAGTLEYLYEISVHLYDWENARFMLQACIDDACEELGQQHVRGFSVASIGRFTPASSGFDAAFGFSLALAEQGDTLATGAIGTSRFQCEEIFPVEVVEGETVLEDCEYDSALTPEEVEELALTQVILDAGAVNILGTSGETWVEQAFIAAPNIEAGDLFGSSVALSADGNTLAVSAVLEGSSATGIDGDMGNNDAPGSGAVYVFTREVSGEETVWTPQAYIKASNTDEGDQFGSVVALSADGQWLAVSAVQEASNAAGIDGDPSSNAAPGAGAVYMFSRDPDSWSQHAYIKASNSGADDLFGGALALNHDGTRLAVGASGESSSASGINGDGFNDAAPDSGAVYVFDRSGLSWTQTAYLKAAAPGAGDRFGWSLALNGDGNRLIAGAPREDSNAAGINGDAANNETTNTGAAYIFDYANGAWSQSTYLKASNADDLDELGYSVAISSGGDFALATAWREGGNSSGVNGNQSLDFVLDSGAAYLFTVDDNVWRQQTYIKASQNAFNLQFGWDSAFARDGAVLGISARQQGGLVFLY